MKKTMPNLNGFTGTTSYTYLNFLKNLKFTDGWTFLANDVGCFWLADIIASVQHKPKIRDNKSFIVWRIETKNNKARVSAYSDSNGTDKDGNPTYSSDDCLYAQIIKYTDFPDGNFEWYQCGDVVLLKGEY